MSSKKKIKKNRTSYKPEVSFARQGRIQTASVSVLSCSKAGRVTGPEGKPCEGVAEVSVCSAGH